VASTGFSASGKSRNRWLSTWVKSISALQQVAKTKQRPRLLPCQKTGRSKEYLGAQSWHWWALDEKPAIAVSRRSKKDSMSSATELPYYNLQENGSQSISDGIGHTYLLHFFRICFRQGTLHERNTRSTEIEQKRNCNRVRSWPRW